MILIFIINSATVPPMPCKPTFLFLAGSAAALVAGCRSSEDPPQMVAETTLTIEAALTDATTLAIQIHDGDAPVVTDVWLYTLGDGAPTPLTGFTSTAARKSPRLMLPATIGGIPSGLAPADDGRMNGLMTNTTRGALQGGTFVSTFDGKVTVTLPAAPTAPILVEAGVEDQRYAGAAVVQPDGAAGVVPSGFGVPGSHLQRSFSRDVAPILQLQCALCHNPAGAEDANFYLVAGSRDELVNDNFALKEQTEDCHDDNPDGGAPLDACVQGITKAQFLVEPGAPAASDLLQRSRPDEEAGDSTLGLAWFGGGNPKSRYNAEYGDRRMPSTTQSTDPAAWTDQPTHFDMHPEEFQILYDWVAQGALDN
ncbi:MAG TPA: hypothetical protein VMT03_09410 [Polyangia bacterium]|nr:hypothetical protein [Polyangia bacterium]